ncbi:MAG: response regulator transcription factor [Clostridia bacterium]|nr:response regulator transcription factor [Clostridia bacterium]
MKVLIVEDDKILSKTIMQCIEKDFSVEQAFDGEEGVLYAKQDIYDAIILDLMMPIMSGYEVLEELRKAKINTPVLILTAKDGLDDKLKGFNLGADDYLVKPFEREELIARLKAIIRRTSGTYNEDTLIFDDLCLNLQNRQATVGDKKLNLQGKQFDILEYLLNYKNTIITKNQIFDKIWGFDSETTTNVVEVYASTLRKELKKVGYEKYLKTVRNVGYIWSSEE